ncbi:MAG: segregation/condensation protein A [Candidatus Liptonbacteria bacterium]|nr:segregation/condensation protein A [Candidatus Liptonbacteria bacterium]
MTYELSLEKYRGPLDKLLELIEERKLEITEISLAEVTQDFLKYLKTLKRVEAAILAEFIAVASRLILIKSRTLLPNLVLTEEEENEIKDLEARLRIYKELKPAMKILVLIWQKKNVAFGRPYFLSLGSGGLGATSEFFYPGKELNLAALSVSLQKIFETLKNLEFETETIKEKIVSVEEKIKELISRLVREVEISFKNLSSSKSAKEIIAVFLAILHLANERLISLEQETHFSDILIKKIG